APSMREGATACMDSVPAAAERQDIGAPEPPRPPLVWLVRLGTVLASVILVSFIVLMAWLQLSGSRLDAVEEPERALALIVGRTMDIDEAVAHAPAWEQFVYRVLSSDPSEDVEEGLRWYEELARESAHPSIDLHLAILEGEARRTDRVRRRTEEWARRADPLPVFALLVGAAYLDEEAERGLPPNVDDALGEVLEPGWFRDRLATRLATRVGDDDLLTAATAAQAERSGRLLARMRVTLAVELVLISVGIVLLVRVVVRRRALHPIRP